MKKSLQKSGNESMSESSVSSFFSELLISILSIQSLFENQRETMIYNEHLSFLNDKYAGTFGYIEQKATYPRMVYMLNPETKGRERPDETSNVLYIISKQ